MGSNEIKDLIKNAQRNKANLLDLSFKNINSLPPEIFELNTLAIFEIYDNQLTSLPPEISKLKNLTALLIYGNQLTSLPSEISELKNLINLDLSRNQLTSLPPEISKLENLTQLNMYSNHLTSLPDEISELKNLTILEVSKNQLTSLPPKISELKNLAILEICDNQLISLPSEISELKNLTELYMYGNRLTSLPSEISELKNLTKLDISNNQLTSLPPEISELKNLTRLNVSHNQLSSLPPEIFGLKNLTQLNISEAKLDSLPPEISKLKNLTQLDISGIKLNSLPSQIYELKNLTQLNISDNQLASLPHEICELKNLTHLNISHNLLHSLPSEIAGLRYLAQFCVSHNLLRSLPSEIVELRHLTKLNVSHNQLRSLPPRIDELKNLTSLNISRNQLASLPHEISGLRNLTQLDISGNKLTSLPSEIFRLRNLTQLNIFGIRLVSLPHEISWLRNLTQLNISGNELSSLPLEISELKYLTQLKISYNQLSSLPPEITKLKNLTQLKISYNQLSSLSTEISELKNLTQLDISFNRLHSLPSEVYKLKYLIQLDTSHNQLSSLSSKIAKLKNLTQLDISHNQLSSIPLEICQLKNLNKLDIRNNQLISLPPEILELDLKIEWEDDWKSNVIYLEGNPLENPPVEIAKQGREAILNYFKSEGEKKQLNEVKVLLIGEGGAGKTSLVKRLFGEKVDGNEPQTQGINIRKLTVENVDKKIKANFWDFGGQEIMHATHQFFLSKRSLYILVLDGRKDEKPEYWLKLIENFGGDSPILVVINKIDENSGFELDRKSLLEKYPSIRGFYRLSCKSNEGVEEFSNTLKEELKAIKHLEIKWPKSWFNVKNKLEKMRPNCMQDTESESVFKHCNFIQYDDYKEICDEEGISSESEQGTLVDFLHDLGVILHFRDIPLLNTHVLEPEWVTNAVYKVVNSKRVADSRGVLKLDMFPEILKQTSENDFYYPVEQYGFIISLMKKFELSYDLDDRTVLLPSLLEIQRPDFEFDSDDALKFIIDYDFLPPSVMPRFIVKINRDIKDDLRWRTGVVLEDKNLNSSAVVRVDNEARRIYIYVDGEQKKDYFAVILHKFREINNSFEKLKATEKIPLPDRPDVTVSYKHLIKLELKGIDMYMPDGSDYEYKVSTLLGTVSNRRGDRLLLEEIFRNTEISKNREKEILEILLNLQEIDTGSDNEDTLIEKISNGISVSFPPSVGLDIGTIVKLYRDWKGRRS